MTTQKEADEWNKKTRDLVKSLYKQGKIKDIQTRSNLVYEKLRKSGYNHLESIYVVLSHGVECNDIMTGILFRWIDG